MIELILRKHPDDVDMIEVIENRDMHVRGRVDYVRTTVWALVHCDAFHDDEHIRDALQAGEEVAVTITAKSSGES